MASGASNRKYYKFGEFPLYVCSHSPACTNPVVMFASGQYYCNEHKPSILLCAHCGCHIAEGYEQAIETTRVVVQVCNECFRIDRERNQLIHGHSYKPEPKFIGAEVLKNEPAFFAGIEQEFELTQSEYDENEEEDDEGGISPADPANVDRMTRMGVAAALIKKPEKTVPASVTPMCSG